MFNPHHEDGFYDNEDAYFAAEDARAEYRAYRESNDYFDTEDTLLEAELAEGDWDAVADSDGDSYWFHDPYEGCYDE